MHSQVSKQTDRTKMAENKIYFDCFQILILIVLGFGAIYVAAAPVNEPSVGTVQIIRSETEQSPDGSYKFS